MADFKDACSEAASESDEESYMNSDIEAFSGESEFSDVEDNVAGIQPYCFEPEYTEAELQAQDDEQAAQPDTEQVEDRQNDMSW